MSSHSQQTHLTVSVSGQSEKLRLPATEFFYKRAMERSAEIRAQIQQDQEAKAASQGKDKAD